MLDREDVAAEVDALTEADTDFPLAVDDLLGFFFFSELGTGFCAPVFLLLLWNSFFCCDTLNRGGSSTLESAILVAGRDKQI